MEGVEEEEEENEKLRWKEEEVENASGWKGKRKGGKERRTERKKWIERTKGKVKEGERKGRNEMEIGRSEK